MRTKFTVLVIISIVLGSLFAGATAYGQGQYDGIWYGEGECIFVHENNGQIIAVELLDDGTYEAYWGNLNGNHVRVYSLYAQYANVTLDVTFTSLTTATVTQVSCRPICPDCYCNYPNGATFQLIKIF